MGEEEQMAGKEKSTSRIFTNYFFKRQFLGVMASKTISQSTLF